VKAIATGNPLIVEKAAVDSQVYQFAAQKRSHLNQHYSINRELNQLPGRIDHLVSTIALLEADAQQVPSLSPLTLIVKGKKFTDSREAMKRLKARVVKKQETKSFSSEKVGKVGDFELWLRREQWRDEMYLVVKGHQEYECNIEHTYVATAESLIRTLSNIKPKIQTTRLRLADARKKLKDLSKHSSDPFAREAELQAAMKRQLEINTELGLNRDNAQAKEDIDATESTSAEVDVDAIAPGEDAGDSQPIEAPKTMAIASV